MKLPDLLAAFLAAGFLLASPGRAADPAPSAPAEPLSDLRRAMLAEYSYTPPGAPAAARPPALQSAAPPIFTADTPRDVVRMAAFEVQEAGTGSPGALLTLDDVKVPPPSLASKLGIGVHGKDLGRVRVFAVTFLYVPFLVGFSW